MSHQIQGERLQRIFQCGLSGPAKWFNSNMMDFRSAAFEMANTSMCLAVSKFSLPVTQRPLHMLRFRISMGLPLQASCRAREPIFSYRQTANHSLVHLLLPRTEAFMVKRCAVR